MCGEVGWRVPSQGDKLSGRWFLPSVTSRLIATLSRDALCWKPLERQSPPEFSPASAFPRSYPTVSSLPSTPAPIAAVSRTQLCRGERCVDPSGARATLSVRVYMSTCTRIIPPKSDFMHAQVFFGCWYIAGVELLIM